MNNIQKIGFGGGCHWCTEAVFLSLKGVQSVEQGWIASEGEAVAFSEAVIVTFNAAIIPLTVLIEVHLRTHNSTAAHSMRKKYRSAIYSFNNPDEGAISEVIKAHQQKFENPLITQILLFSAFKPSREDIVNYYYKNPKKPFCETFINPKLKILLDHFSAFVKHENLQHLDNTPEKQ